MNNFGFLVLAFIGSVAFFGCNQLSERAHRFSNGRLREKYHFFKNQQNKEIKEGLHTRWDSSGAKIFDINWHDGRMHGSAVYYYGNGRVKSKAQWLAGKRSGILESFYPGGQKKQEGNWHEDLPNGRWRQWHLNGLVKSEISFEKGEKNGMEQVWNDRGELLFKRFWRKGSLDSLSLVLDSTKIKSMSLNYSDGKIAESFQYYVGPDGEKVKHGAYKEWYPSGQIEREVEFIMGIKDGEETWYHNNDKKKQVTSWKLGKKSGKEITWWPNALKRSEEEFSNGARNGPALHWYENGNKKSEAFYVDNELEDTAKYWFENGSIKTVYPYKGAALHGRVIYGYKNGKIKSSCEYVGGMLAGLCIEWWENGNKRSELSYQNGEKQPHTLKMWDSTGRPANPENKMSVTQKSHLESNLIQAAETCRRQIQRLDSLSTKLDKEARHTDLQALQFGAIQIKEGLKRTCNSFLSNVEIFKTHLSEDEFAYFSTEQGFGALDKHYISLRDSLLADDGFGDF